MVILPAAFIVIFLAFSPRLPSPPSVAWVCPVLSAVRHNCCPSICMALPLGCVKLFTAGSDVTPALAAPCDVFLMLCTAYAFVSSFSGR